MRAQGSTKKTSPSNLMGAEAQRSEWFGSLKYRAFISYSHNDEAAATWLHSALERFRLFRGMRPPHRHIRPNFRDDAEVAANPDLGAILRQALRESEALIVVCSPNAAASRWVNDEITEFKRLGRQDRIYAVVVAGELSAGARNCFPPALLTLADADGGAEDRVVEPLAVDLRSHGKRDTVLKVAAALLELPFDALKRRERIRRIRRTAGSVAGIVVVLAAYTTSLVLQTRAVNRQLSAILAATARESSDRGENGRALRFAVMAAHENVLAPAAEIAEPILIRASHYSTLEDVLPRHTAAVYSVAFDATGDRLITGSQDRTARVWQRDASGRWRQAGGAIQDDHVMSVHFVENGGAVAVVSLAGMFRIWRRVGDNWIAAPPLSPETAGIRCFDSTPDGNLLCIGRNDQSLRLWRFSGGQWSEEAMLPTGGRLPARAALAGNGRCLVVAYAGGPVEFFEPGDRPASWSKTDMYLDFDYEPQHAAFASSGRRVALAWLGDVRILDRDPAGRWRPSGRINSDRLISHAVFDASSERLVVTNGKSVAANFWLEERVGNWVAAFAFHADREFTRSISPSPSGRLATGGNDGYPRIWTPGGTGSWGAYAKVRTQIGLVKDVDAWTHAHTSFTEPRATSPDKRREAIGNVYGIARIMDQLTGIEVAAFDVSDTPRYALRFSDDGRTLQVLEPENKSVIRKIDTELVAGLRGSALIDRICSQKLRPPLSIVNEADIEAMPAIRDRLHQDVSARPNWLQKLLPSSGTARQQRP
jgi:WD40 repeat protein